MPFPQKFLLLSRKPLLLATVFVALKIAAFAQVTSLATHSPGVILVRDETAIWHLITFILGGSVVFGASIFWWRRDKSQDENLPSDTSANKGKAKDSSLRKTQSKNATESQNNDNAEVNANVASWIQNNISGKTPKGNQNQDSLKKQNNNSSAARAQTINLFRLPNPLPPIVPLPALNNESLLDAIEQVQDLDATEDQREVAVNVIMALKSRNAVEALAQVAHYDESSRLRIAALNGLGAFDHESVFEPVLLTCADPAREVRAAAARTLARLSINRADAYTRIVESEDTERLRLASMVCIDAGLASHALARLTHHDNQQANDAFAMVRLLVAAGQFAPITKIISDSNDLPSSLIMIKALKAIKPIKMRAALSHLISNAKISVEVKTALNELVAALKVT